MFMGTVKLLGSKLVNNDPVFFRKFTSNREKLEKILIDNKDLVATILQKNMSAKRTDVYAKLLEAVINQLDKSKSVDEQFLIDSSGLRGKLIVGSAEYSGKKFSDDEKSQAFIYTALASAMKCPICNGYLDPEKSVSYDHIVRARDDGKGESSNCQLTHPYCNQSIKQ
ncbi:MAG: HNH endonuclease signature motif containing protein [Gammaproteobacteria bacterium]